MPPTRGHGGSHLISGKKNEKKVYVIDEVTNPNPKHVEDVIPHIPPNADGLYIIQPNWDLASYKIKKGLAGADSKMLFKIGVGHGGLSEASNRGYEHYGAGVRARLKSYQTQLGDKDNVNFCSGARLRYLGITKPTAVAKGSTYVSKQEKFLKNRFKDKTRLNSKEFIYCTPNEMKEALQSRGFRHPHS